MITSGASCLIFSRAMYGSDAVPTTWMPGSLARISLISCRTSAESSTTRTLIGAFAGRCGGAIGDFGGAGDVLAAARSGVLHIQNNSTLPPDGARDRRSW